MLNFIRNYLNEAGADGAAGGSSGAAGSGAPAGSGAAPAAGQAAAGATPGAAAPLAAPSSMVAEAKPTIPTATEQGGKPAPAAAEPGKTAPATAAAPTKEAMQARLIAKGGKKEDVEKLTDADLAKQYEAVKPPAYTDFKLPETVKLDANLLPDLKAVFAKHELSQAQAEGLLAELGSKIVSAQDAQAYVKAELEKPYQLWADTQAQWQAEVKADPEVGGQHLDKSLATIAAGIDMFAKDANDAKAIRQAFAYTGAGNNPAIIRLLTRALAPYMEGGHAAGGKPAGQQQKSAAETLYPKMAPGTSQ